MKSSFDWSKNGINKIIKKNEMESIYVLQR